MCSEKTLKLLYNDIIEIKKIKFLLFLMLPTGRDTYTKISAELQRKVKTCFFYLLPGLS